MAYFKCGSGSGSSVTIDDVVYEGDLKLLSDNGDIKLPNLIYDHFRGCAVVLNGEIHILGGTYNKRKHCKYNGSSWVEVSTLPYDFYQGSAVVYNGEIHILSGVSDAYNHYKFNESTLTWTRVSTLPNGRFSDGNAVILDGAIHMLGATYHYKYNGSWTSVSTIPITCSNNGVVVLNGEIHILGTKTYHYKYNGSWTSVSTLPYDFYYGKAVVLNGEIHILGTNYTDKDSSTSNTRYYSFCHYKYSSDGWVQLKNLPFPFSQGCAVVLNNIIHIMGTYTDFTVGDYKVEKFVYKIDAPIYEIAS